MPTAHDLLTRSGALAAYVAEWNWARAVRDGLLSLPAARQSFLVKGIEEDEDEFAKRAELCEYAALTPSLDRRISGAVWKRPATRTIPDKLADAQAKITQEGDDSGEFTRQVVMEALWKRFAVALVDRPVLPAVAKPLTAADDKAAGLDKPYAVLYSAEQICEYRAGRDGRLAYIRLAGPVYAEGENTVTEVREVDLTGIKTWRIIHAAGAAASTGTVEGGELVPLADGLVAARQLPVAVCRFDPIDCLLARTPLSEALRAELRAMRLLSDILWDLWLAGHPMMLCTMRRELAKVGIGINKFLRLEPGDQALPPETVTWLEANLPGLVQQIETYKDARNDIWLQAGIKTQTPTAKTDAKSGTAIATEFEQTEANTLSAIADMAADFEFDLLSIIALEMGLSAPDTLAEDISIAYPKDFSLQSPERLLLTAQTLRNLTGPESAATKEALRRAIMACLDGISEETRKEIEADLKGGAYQPPAPDFLGGAPGPFGKPKSPPKSPPKPEAGK